MAVFLLQISVFSHKKKPTAFLNAADFQGIRSPNYHNQAKHKKMRFKTCLSKIDKQDENQITTNIKNTRYNALSQR